VAEHVDDRRRQVVPRWWPLRVAATLGQLDATTAGRDAASPTPAPGELEHLQRDWAREQNPIHAAGLVDAALVLRSPEIAVEAADWLVKNGGVSEASVRLAQHVLTPPVAGPAEDAHLLRRQDRYLRVAEIRRRLRQMPRNPLLWVELAREYSSLGEMRATSKALHTALGLAPDSRFVLRCASRFFLHAHDPELAHGILLRSSATAADPWLMAAEIVAAQAAESHSRMIRQARRHLSSSRFAPLHVSELASALGTIEFHAGSRRVHKLFAQALEDPTENSVAQAGWIGRHLPSFTVGGPSLAAPRAFEARAWEAVVSGDHLAAVNNARDWLADEPFATRPALFGSWVASTALGDHAAAIEFIEVARVANPDDPRLIAELLYNKASIDDVDSAEELLPSLERSIEGSQVDLPQAGWDVLLAADRGLIAFRRGSYAAGRDWYSKALDVASEHGLPEFGASALMNLAREEARIGGGANVGREALERAVEVFPQPARGAAAKFVSRIACSRAE
jgi:tetratricopeptide (TPR) repeat protein